MVVPSLFVPLRTDPPPNLATTLWIRSALALTILFTAVSIVVGEFVHGPGRIWFAPAALIPHVAVVVLLIVWSDRSMANVDAILPPARYSRSPRGAVAGALWAAGFVAPVMAVVVVGRIGSRFADDEAFVPTMAAILVALVALFAAWLPFRYHARQASRIGAPHMIMAAWFWVPLMTFVGGASVLAYVYHDRFGDEPFDSVIGVGGIYGLAAGVFALSTWRAVTVFDEVIDLRWQRWKTEWEQTMVDLAAEPAPPPER